MNVNNTVRSIWERALLFVGLALILVYFSPLLFEGDYAIPSTYPDGWAFLWSLWRYKFVLHGEESLYFSEIVFHPFGSELALHTQVEALFLPFSTLLFSLSLIKVFSLSVVLCFVLNLFFGFFLFRKLSKSSFVAFFLAIALTFHPHFLGHLEGGHVNFLFFFPVCIYFGCLLSEESSWRSVALVALAVGLMIYSNLYYLYFSLFATLILFLFSASRFFLFKKVSGGIIGGMLLGAPKILSVVRSYLSGGFRDDHNPLQHSAGFFDFVLPSPHQMVSSLWSGVGSSELVRVNSAELGAYFGFSLLLLGILVFICRRAAGSRRCEYALLFTAVIFFSLSFGPGEWVVPTPYRVMNAIFPFFPSVPIRLAFFGIF